jgi:hypothetical protein
VKLQNEELHRTGFFHTKKAADHPTTNSGPTRPIAS